MKKHVLSETYVTDPYDPERDEAPKNDKVVELLAALEASVLAAKAARVRHPQPVVEDPLPEGTDLQQQAFKAKMEAFRNGGMFSYGGPRAARD